MNVVERRLLEAVEFSSYIASFAEPGREILFVESYTYTVDAQDVDIDNTAAQDFPLIMDSDSDFICTALSGAAVISEPVIADPANGNSCTEFSPSLLVQLRDEAKGKTFFNIPTPLPLIAGAGGFPFLLSSPRVIRPRSTITVSAEAAASDVVFSSFFFSLHGGKIYYAGPTP